MEVNTKLSTSFKIRGNINEEKNQPIYLENGLSSKDVEEAAGGLLWKTEAGSEKIAIVYRERYGGEWTLPKGKKLPGESWIDTATREVREETGCTSIDVIDFAGCICYSTGIMPKIVLFWNMRAQGECMGKRDEESVKIEWVTIDEAMRKLRYPNEKNLLATVR